MKKILIILVLLCAGCQPVLHPMEGHVFPIKKGECGAKQDGYYFSRFYVEEVMQVRVEE